MLLSKLQEGDYCKILSINADQHLKSRFNSFGITKGAKINLLKTTFAKETIEIQVIRTKIALRISEASKIKVELC